MTLTLKNISDYLKHPAWLSWHKTLEKWEDEYRAGRWGYLSQIGELAHYSVIAGYIQHFGRRGSLLDLGSGSGTLIGKINPADYTKYLGIDFSKTALRATSGKGHEKASFLLRDVISYIPEEKYDHIILNEVLNYFENPLTILKRYENYLKENGIYLISFYLNFREHFLLKKITQVYDVIDKVKITNGKKGWICLACKPKGRKKNLCV